MNKTSDETMQYTLNTLEDEYWNIKRVATDLIAIRDQYYEEKSSAIHLALFSRLANEVWTHSTTIRRLIDAAKKTGENNDL